MISRLMSAAQRHALPVVVDALIVVVSLFLAWSGRSITAPLMEIQLAARFSLLATCTYCAVNYLFRIYRRLWRYASASEVVVLGASVGVSTAILFVLDAAIKVRFSQYGERLVPLSVVPFMGFFAFAGFVAVRYRSRIWTGWRPYLMRLWGPLSRARTHVLIVGAAEDGQLFAWRLLNQQEGDAYSLVGFVDDNPAMKGMRLHGRPILGGREAIPALVAAHHIDLIIISTDRLNNDAMRDTLAICEHTSARVKVLPDVFDFIHRTSGLPPLRDVTAEDLLGRKAVAIDRDACSRLLSGKAILVTGAAGSIGSELCRQIATFSPRCLLMLDNNESGLYDLGAALEFNPGCPPTQSIIGDITDAAKMQTIFEKYHPDIVFHAAAYKHVPLMEEYPEEAVRVNVLGTLVVLDLACRYQVERFVIISTDKAVSPTCIMGATKRLSEMLIASFAPDTKTLCTGVRFGNVLGSRGSVVPKFERQIEMGGPITITHPEMTRFFMSIPEAVSLVIQAATLTQGDDLFVLDMGEQVRIEELAQRLIRLRGLRPEVDIPIKYTGIRNGEKLHEELTGDGDEKQPTSHPAIFRVLGNHRMNKEVLLGRIDELAQLAGGQKNGQIVAAIWDIVRHSPDER